MNKYPDDVFIVAMYDRKGKRNDVRRCYSEGEVFYCIDEFMRKHSNCRFSYIEIVRKEDDR